jgi:hypothetical protein
MTEVLVVTHKKMRILHQLIGLSISKRKGKENIIKLKKIVILSVQYSEQLKMSCYNYLYISKKQNNFDSFHAHNIP